VSNASNTAVTWTMSPSIGTLSASGLYTAPASISAQQTVTITATSAADGTKSGSATLTLNPPVAVSLNPTSASLSGGQSQQFTATVSNASNPAVTWTMSPSLGTLSASGLYRAPASISAQQTVTITATPAADASKAASAAVTLLASQLTGVQVVGVTPNAGSGLSQTFQFSSSDSAGTNDLTQVWMRFTPAYGVSANSCQIYYSQIFNYVYLLNDAGTEWMPMSAGAAGTLQNSQCSLNVGAMAIARNGNTLMVSLPMTFAAAYTGPKQVWMYALGITGLSGWQQRGTWNVP